MRLPDSPALTLPIPLLWIVHKIGPVRREAGRRFPDELQGIPSGDLLQERSFSLEWSPSVPDGERCRKSRFLPDSLRTGPNTGLPMARRRSSEGMVDGRDEVHAGPPAQGNPHRRVHTDFLFRESAFRRFVSMRTNSRLVGRVRPALCRYLQISGEYFMTLEIPSGFVKMLSAQVWMLWETL